MEVQIVSLSQDVSFEDGSITNFITFRVPSGNLIRAIISEDSVPVLTENLAAGIVQPKTASNSTISAETRAEEPALFGEQSAWFPGGVKTGPTPASSYVNPALQSADAATQASAYRDQQRQQKESLRQGAGRNGRHVTADEYGYPIVANSGGMDPGELSGSGSSEDEDGIGSI